MKPVHLRLPVSDRSLLLALRAGDKVLLSGPVYAARDAAHRRMADALNRGEALPFDPHGAGIYYVGPTPPPPGKVIGSAGPTTAYRMDVYTPRLYGLGLALTLGKGKRSPEVRQALADFSGVYLGATGGAGALLARHITASEVVAWEDLGTEAVRRLTLEDFPAIVVYDAHGGSVFSEAAE